MTPRPCLTTRSRMRRDGQRIECPHCGETSRVGHLAWSALQCTGCHALVEKIAWIDVTREKDGDRMADDRCVLRVSNGAYFGAAQGTADALEALGQLQSLLRRAGRRVEKVRQWDECVTHPDTEEVEMWLEELADFIEKAYEMTRGLRLGS